GSARRFRRVWVERRPWLHPALRLEPAPATARTLDQQLPGGRPAETDPVHPGEPTKQGAEAVDLEGEGRAPARVVRPGSVERPPAPLHQQLLEHERFGVHLAQADAVLAREVVLPVALPRAGGDAGHSCSQLGAGGEVLLQGADTTGRAREREQIRRE